MAEIPGVWSRRPRRRGRSERLPSLYGHGNIDSGFSEGCSLSSDCDVIGHERRDVVLDDALIGFFREEAVKSLKRNFSDFFKDSMRIYDAKKSKSVGVDKSAFTRFGSKYFLEVIKKLTPEHRGIIQKFGFGCLLLFDCSYLSSDFCSWVAKSVDLVCSHMSICGKYIGISKDTFHIVLGLPIGGLPVPCSDDGLAFILSLFKLSGIPHITFFGNKLSSPVPLSELEVFVCFMTIAISCFLCPDISHSVNINYLGILKDPASAKGYDFSQLVYGHCLNRLNELNMFGNLKGRTWKSPGCCFFVPVVRYLDCLDFGSQNVALCSPRVLVWKGSMIKKFSDLDRKCRKQFGKKLLKEVWIAGNYPKGLGSSHIVGTGRISPVLSPLSGDFKAKVRDQFLGSLHADVIDGIMCIGDSFLSTKSSSSKRKLELLLNSVFDFLSKSSDMRDTVHGNLKSPVGSNFVPPTSIVSSALAQRGFDTVDPAELQHNAFDCLQECAKITASACKRTAEPVTPDCMITSVVEGGSNLTAPGMVPLRKVKARNCKLISEVVELNSFNRSTCSVPTKGSIDVVDVPESPCLKPQLEDQKLNRLSAHHTNGSKIAPIKISDSSPNASMIVKDGSGQIVGSNDFQRKLSELSKIADNTYNTMMNNNQKSFNGVLAAQETVVDAQAHVVSKDAQSVPKSVVHRKFMFVNWLVSLQNPPLQANRRFPVTQEDIIHYSAIVELAHSSHQKTLGMLYPKVHCSYKSLGVSLMPKGEIDNFLLPCFCRVMFEERHPSSSGRHYFFPNIGDAILKYTGEHQESTVINSFEGATKASKGRKLGHKDNRLFFPIVHSGHWFAFVVDFEENVFAFLDSYYDKNSSFHTSVRNRLIDNFVHLWELIISPNHNFGDFQAMYPDVPKQPNLKDCGVFMMKFMETWTPFIDTRSIFSYNDILNIRILYAIKLYFYAQNEADLSLVTDFYSMG